MDSRKYQFNNSMRMICGDVLASKAEVIVSSDERSISSDMYLAYLKQGVGREMARCSHTPTFCLGKLGSSIKAGKKQLRVWLQYVCDMAEMLLYSSFDSPLVLLWTPYMGSEDSQWCKGRCTEVPQ